MNVKELIAILANVDYDTPVEIEIECLDGGNRRAVDVTAQTWQRGPTGGDPVFIIEGNEPPRRKVRDEPQS